MPGKHDVVQNSSPGEPLFLLFLFTSSIPCVSCLKSHIVSHFVPPLLAFQL